MVPEIKSCVLRGYSKHRETIGKDKTVIVD